MYDAVYLLKRKTRAAQGMKCGHDAANARDEKYVAMVDDDDDVAFDVHVAVGTEHKRAQRVLCTSTRTPHRTQSHRATRRDATRAE